MARRRRGGPAGPRPRRATRRPAAAAPARVPAKGATATTPRPRRARHKRSTTPWLLAGLIALVVVGGLGFLAFREVTKERPGIALTDLGNQHLTNADDPHVAYNSSPPTSGPHLNTKARGGIHAEPIPNELQVHNLEDGFVVVQYDCPSACPDLVSQLESVVRPALTENRSVIMAPYSGIRSPDGVSARIALTAWTRIDAFDEFDRDRVANFIKAYEGQDHHVP